MKTLGFNLETKTIRYTALEGEKTAPVLIEKDRQVVNLSPSIPKLMDWYDSTFQNLLSRIKPDKIGCKLNLNAKKSQIPFWYYPYGVLSSLAYKSGIDIVEFTSQNFTPSKFGLAKSTDLYAYIDNVFGEHPPYWDKNQKYSLLSAWTILN